MKYSEEELLELIGGLATDLGRVPTRREMDECDELPASGTYRRAFGSWNDALRQAGLKPTNQAEISDEELFEALRSVAADLGHPPTIVEMQTYDDLPSPSTYRSRFGSWSQAHREAGLEPRTQKTYSDETLLKGIVDLAAEVGGRPTANQMDERGPYAVSVYQRAFSSWTTALQKAGFDPVQYRYSDKELLEALRRITTDLGRSPQVTDAMEDDDFPSLQVYYDRFDSWANALERAGIEPPPSRKYTDDELLVVLREFADSLGRAPTMEEIQTSESMPGPTVFKDHFGTWNDALREAGLDPVRRAQYTDEELLDTLRDLATILNKTPTMQEIQEREGLPSSSVYQNQFGSWNSAVREAGLEPN